MHLHRPVLALLVIVGHICLWAQLASYAQSGHDQRLGMVTGARTGAYFQLGQDIAKAARLEGIDIVVKGSEGSIDNFKRLISEENASLAIVQSDILGLLNWRSDFQSDRMARKLRVVFPLHHEAVHVLARREVERLQDLEGKRVIADSRGSDTWFTAKNLLGQLNVEPATWIDDLAPPEAARAVLTGAADAMFVVAGNPIPLFQRLTDLQQDARFAPMVHSVHFVPIDIDGTPHEYVASTIGPSDYAWMSDTVQTVAVRAVLISFDFSSVKDDYYQFRCQQLANLAQALRTQMPALQQTGHPAWKEVDLNAVFMPWPRDVCSHATRALRPPHALLLQELSESLKE